MEPKSVVILFGPPGSGKGTQANMLAAKFGLVHFDSGKFFESLLYGPRRGTKAVRRERKLFEAGTLNSSRFVIRAEGRLAARLAQAGLGLVLSGSPRALSEAEQVIPLLEKLYGRTHMFFFEVRVPPPTSISRNVSRLICRSCGTPLLSQLYSAERPRRCPVCGGSFYRRTLDNVRALRTRLKEYEARTKPVFAWLRKRGYWLEVIDGRPAPYKVFERIAARLER